MVLAKARPSVKFMPKVHQIKIVYQRGGSMETHAAMDSGLNTPLASLMIGYGFPTFT